MEAGQQNQTTNVVLLRTRSDGPRDAPDAARHENIIRLLDLSKYEQPRRPVENRNADMRANIAAIVLLGFLVFIAREDFCALERANLCLAGVECYN